MDRYQRVEKPKAETPINENEIRITTQGRMRNYITYATTLLQVLSLSLSLSTIFFILFFSLDMFTYFQSLLLELCGNGGHIECWVF
jgi:hypothetical protein